MTISLVLFSVKNKCIDCFFMCSARDSSGCDTALRMFLTQVVLVVTIACVTACAEDKKVTFVFTEYPYKETSKNELSFREFESACEQSPSCTDLSGISRVRCVRECLSPSCYHEIYQPDPLEEGEIDVRLNSFKGCFVQRASRTRP